MQSPGGVGGEPRRSRGGGGTSEEGQRVQRPWGKPQGAGVVNMEQEQQILQAGTCREVPEQGSDVMGLTL